jgi:hypothetical protein
MQMNEILEHRFAIKRACKPTDEEYLKALSIYNATTPNDIKTKTNEISMWLGKNNSANTFELFLFTLYLDNDIIGFAMLSYIPKCRVVVYDYIALKEQYRVNTVLFSYISLIQNYLSLNKYDVAFYVVEISNKHDGKGVDKESRLFRKLICLEGYGRIKAKYQTVPLGLEHYESSFDAYLYIKSSDTLEIISKETFMSIIHAIYYDYYLSWYTPILNHEELRVYKEEKIDLAYSSLKMKLSEEIQFEIEYADCPMMGNLQFEKTYGDLPSKKKKSIGKYPLIGLLVLTGPPLLIWGYNVVLELLGIPLSTVSSFIGGVFTAILSSVTALTIANRKKL